MAEPRFFGTVRFTAEASLDVAGPADYVLRIEGRVSGGLGVDGRYVAREENVALIEAYFVQLTPLDLGSVPLGDVCDLHSDQLEGVYAALFDEEDELREDLAIRGYWDALLHISWLEIDAKYRRSGLVSQTIEAAIRHFCPAGIVTAHSSVLGLSPAEWRDLGFRRIAGSEVVYRDNTAEDPYGHPLDEEE